MFLDKAEIHVQSGKGGDGAVHFRREKFVPRGGPDGGDGGRGGDVILEVLPTLNTLYAFRHQTRFRAKDGERGQRSNMTGKSADHLLIPVAPGTIVFDAANGELLGDLLEPGQQLIVAKGGRGGRGNQHFANSSHQVPRVAERGEPGEERILRLELKLIADVGIVGVPNAGKSTLLAAVTSARPKIGAYPFTTLEPNLGVANLDEDTPLVLADIPGLIEGAHLGIGLGHDFLRHIQRTRVLIHLLDGMADDPLLDFAQINSELALFDPELARKPQVVVLNKMDLPEVQARWPQIAKTLKLRFKSEQYDHIDPEPFAISAVAGSEVRSVLWRAYQLLQQAPPPQAIDEMPVYRPKSDPNAYTVSQVDAGWRVTGVAIERAAKMTFWEQPDSIQRFQRILETIGVEAALRKAGIQEGETVFIGEFELEWQD
jgi:GTP-binding protein